MGIAEGGRRKAEGGLRKAEGGWPGSSGHGRDAIRIPQFAIRISRLILATVAFSAARAETRLLSGFETDADLRPWATNAAKLERVATPLTEGQSALGIVLQPGEFPGISLGGSHPLLSGWEKYDFLRFEIYSPQAQLLPFTVRLDDLQSHDHGSRFNDEFLLRPGLNRLEYPLRRLVTTDGKRALDPAWIERLMLFSVNPGQPLVILLDNLRLETQPTEGVAPAGVRAFDFGPKSSPVMGSFTPVTAADGYDPARGWGWTSTGPRLEIDRQRPDALCRDFVSGDPEREFTETFAIDVPNRNYLVTVCGQHLGAAGAVLAARTYRIRAEGEDKARVEITADEFFTDRFLFRGRDGDWWPEQDVWRELVQPAFPEHSFTVTVTDGQLNLEFENTAVYWLTVAPEGTTFSPTQARRREFYDRYFYLEPDRPAPNPARMILHAARDQPVTVFFNSPAPPAVEGLAALHPELRAVRLRMRAVSRGVYRVGPAELVASTNCPHASRFALTVRGGQPGVHRGTVAGMGIEVRVWPFLLPTPAELDITFGWWYAGNQELNYRFGLFRDKAAAARALRDRELRDMAAHGFNSVSLPAPRMSHGKLDLAALDDFLAGGRAAGLVTRHRTMVSTLDLARDLSRQLKTAEFSELFLPPFTAALGQLRSWVETNRYPVLACVGDEPREQVLNAWNRNFAGTKRVLELCLAAGLPTVVTLMRDESFGEDSLPLVNLMDVVATHPYRESRGIIETARRRQTGLWLYNAGMNRLSFGFHPWAVGASGRWEWHYQWWGQAYDPFAAEEGLGAVMPSPDGPVPTEAYERVRAGIDDYRFVFLLERMIARHPGQNAGEAKRLLEEIRGKVPRYLGEPNQPVGEATLDEWRGRIAGAIGALAGAK